MSDTDGGGGVMISRILRDIELLLPTSVEGRCEYGPDIPPPGGQQTKQMWGILKYRDCPTDFTFARLGVYGP